MIRTRGLHHINLNVRDIERSLRFYQELFGLEVMFWEGDGMVFLRTPGGFDTITLCAAGPDAPIAGGGVSHFGFALVDKRDLDTAAEEIERAGGKVLRRGEHAPGAPYLYCADPDGYVIEL
jgi:catechol 2,3-dioxygenase-like lactoylglutathione lyase family enzyme